MVWHGFNIVLKFCCVIHVFMNMWVNFSVLSLKSSKVYLSWSRLSWHIKSIKLTKYGRVQHYTYWLLQRNIGWRLQCYTDWQLQCNSVLHVWRYAGQCLSMTLHSLTSTMSHILKTWPQKTETTQVFLFVCKERKTTTKTWQQYSTFCI